MAKEFRGVAKSEAELTRLRWRMKFEFVGGRDKDLGVRCALPRGAAD